MQYSSVLSIWMILQLVILVTVVWAEDAGLLEADEIDWSSVSSSVDEEPEPCYDPNTATWYDHMGRLNGGAGCGGCTCLNGHWHCSSCRHGELVCPRINCDQTCDSSHYEVRKDSYGCRYCRCYPEEYCEDICEFCLRLPEFMKCPSGCHCL